MAAFMVRIVAPLCLVILPLPVAAGNSVLTASVHLRTGPGIGYSRLATLPQGGVVYVHACTHTQSWCHVSYGHFSGWASARYMAATLPVSPYVGAYSGVVTQHVQPVYPPAGSFVTGTVPVLHGHVQPPPVVVHSHTSRYLGRVVHYRQVVTSQPVVTYQYAYPYLHGGMGTFPVDLR